MLQVLAVVIGFVSGFFTNIASGGGALIMLPALLILGIEPLDAIGSIKLGAIGLVLGSVAGSKKTGLVRKDLLRPMIAIVVIAAIIGPQISLRLTDDTVKIISSLFIISTALATIATRNQGIQKQQVSKTRRNIGFVLYFITTTILAGFGSAIGLLSSYVLIGFLGMSALETTVTRRITGLIGLPLQLIFFSASGHVNVPVGAALFIGCTVGGFLGLKLAIRQGNLFVKRAMAAASIVLVVSLFL